MRVLVTGGSGFVGRALVARLAADGLEVHTTSREDGPGPGIRHAADLTDASATRELMEQVRPSHLVHAAWFRATGAVRATGAANLEWTEISLRVLREFAEAGGLRCVGIGTCFEYDPRVPSASESTPLRPWTLYGQCKAAIGRTSMAFGDAVGVSVAWVRGFFMYGPGEARRRLVADVALSLLSGERVATTEGSQERDFLHVDDVAAGLALVLRSDYVGAVNLASGTAVPVRRVVELVAGFAGGLDRVDFGAVERAPDDPDRIAADVDLMRTTFGWSPRISLEEGLASTVDHWRRTLDGTSE